MTEIRENFDDIRKICEVEDFQYIPGKMNPVDIVTREDGKLDEIGINSEWQSPSFLKKSCESWPHTRDFIKTEPPVEEMRKKSSATCLAIQAAPPVQNLWKRIENICHYSNDWGKVLRIVARVTRGTDLDLSGYEKGKLPDLVSRLHRSETPIDKTFSVMTKFSISKSQKIISDLSEPDKFKKLVDVVTSSITKKEMEIAEQLVMLLAMNMTWQDYRDKKFTSLLLFEENFLIYTRGRVGEAALDRILGVDKLPVFSSKSRVAWLLMYRAHTEDTGLDHRGVAATLSKSRTRAWIVQGGKLAKSVVFRCNYCKLRNRKLESQLNRWLLLEMNNCSHAPLLPMSAWIIWVPR